MRLPMDETDIKISFELCFDARMPYRELAEKMKMSSIAVHRRVNHLLEIGVIRAFRASPSLNAVEGTVVAISGQGELDPIDIVLNGLEKDGRPYKLIRSPGGFVFIECLLRSISELDDLVTKVKGICRISKPRLLIPVDPYRKRREGIQLSKTDSAIIRSLSRNCRKPLNEVAEELDLSTRTVRRRMDKMTNEGSIELWTEMVPTSSNDIISFFFLNLEEGQDRDVLAHRIWKDNYPKVMTIIPFSNEPDLLIANCWSRSMKDIEDLKDHLLKNHPIESIELNVLYDMHFIDSWRDKLVDE